MALDADGRIFMVKHSYVPGWHLPGGGVEARESMAEALGRELMEEGNIEILQAPRLFAIYHNRSVSGRDHVALFVIEFFHAEQTAAAKCRDYRAWILRPRRSAAGYDRWNTGADRGSAGWGETERILVTRFAVTSRLSRRARPPKECTKTEKGLRGAEPFIGSSMPS